MLKLSTLSFCALLVCVLLNLEITTALIHRHHLACSTRRNVFCSTQRKPRGATSLHQGYQRELALPNALIEEPLFIPDSVIPLILIIALSLGYAANGWIGQLLNGKDKKSGLGAFLKDGSGYNRSGFSMQDSDRAVQSDPLPWLKLPKFDYVEVAGQEQIVLEEKLEKLRLDLNIALRNGDRIEAKKIERQLEDIMRKSGIEFQIDEQSAHYEK